MNPETNNIHALKADFVVLVRCYALFIDLPQRKGCDIALLPSTAIKAN